MLLGYEPEDFVGSSLLNVLHRDDLPYFLLAVGNALLAGRESGVHVRLRHSGGEWSELSAVLTPVSEGARLAFLLVACPPEHTVTPNRVNELEMRLPRIAYEVHASGIPSHLRPALDPPSHPALLELTNRQIDIVQRLVAGERVPCIAKAMFVSQSTIRNHLTHIYRRFGVHSQQELLFELRNHERS